MPETSISLSEVDQLLHERLGNDLYMGGDLVLNEDGGLAPTVRGDGVPARTFQSAAGDLDRLTMRPADHFYGRAQGLQFATYLVTNVAARARSSCFQARWFRRARGSPDHRELRPGKRLEVSPCREPLARCSGSAFCSITVVHAVLHGQCEAVRRQVVRRVISNGTATASLDGVVIVPTMHLHIVEVKDLLLAVGWNRLRRGRF